MRCRIQVHAAYCQNQGDVARAFCEIEIMIRDTGSERLLKDIYDMIDVYGEEDRIPLCKIFVENLEACITDYPKIRNPKGNRVQLKPCANWKLRHSSQN